MKNPTLSLDSEDVKKVFLDFEKIIVKYKGIILFLVFATLYGFISWRINTLSTAQPNQSDIKSAQQVSKNTKIPQEAVNRMQRMEAGSTRVKALFNEARSNPFQE